MIGSNNNNAVVNRMQHDKYLQLKERHKKKLILKQQQQQQQQQQQHEQQEKERIKQQKKEVVNNNNNSPERIKISLKNNLNIDVSDIFNTIYDVNENDHISLVNHNKDISFCNYSYHNVLKSTYIELTCLRTTVKSIDKKTTLPSPKKSINQDGNVQFPYPIYAQDKRYHVREELLFNRHIVGKEKQRNQEQFSNDKKKFLKDKLHTLKEWDGLETASMVKRVFTRRRLPNFHRTASEINTIININTEYEMKCKTYDFDNDHDIALFRSELCDELIILEKLADLTPIPGLSLDPEEKIHSRRVQIVSNAMIRIRRFIKKSLSNYKSRKAMQLFAKKSLFEKRDNAVRKIQGRIHLFLMRCRLDRIKIYQAVHKIQTKYRIFRYRRRIKIQKAQQLMESRRIHAVLVIQSYFYPKMNFNRRFPILEKFQETFKLIEASEQEFNFADAALIATDIVHKNRTHSTYNDASITDKAGKKNDDFLLMEAKYMYDEGVQLSHAGDYINACHRLDSALDIRRSIYKSEDNDRIIEVKQAYASAFMSMGDFNKASLLFEELLEVLESLIHNEDYDSVAKHRQYINVLISLAEAKVNQLLLNDATDMLLKLKMYLNDIQKEVNHHHNLFSDKDFEIRECRLNAKISLQQGQYDKACSIYRKIIDLTNNDLSEYGDYDDDKSSMTIHQLQCASYIVDAYDNLAEISLIFYKIDDFRTLHATSLSVKCKYFEESHPTFGYSKYLEAKLNSALGSYKQAYEIVTELILSESSKYNDKSTILAKYICLQADLETLFGLFGNHLLLNFIQYHLDSYKQMKRNRNMIYVVKLVIHI